MGSGPENFPGSSWEQVPAMRWKPSMEGAIEGRFSLHHDFDNPESGCDYLVFNHNRLGDSDSLVFSFRLRHGYAPSSSNNWQVALLAEFQKESMEIEEGIVLGVNFLGSDDLIRIWQCKEGIPAELCISPVNYQEEVGTDGAPLFRLVWYREGLLRLFYAKDPALEEPVQIGSCMLEQQPAGRQMVFRYEYSSARDRNLWIDEVILDGNFVKDSLAPLVTGVEVAGEKKLKVSFSERIVDPAEGIFLIGNTGAHVLWMEGADVMLEFPDPFPNRIPLELFIGNICDMDQNCMSDTLIAFMRNEAVWGDVVINEILADPEPPIRLPDEEYLELYNRSEYPLDLENWTMEVNSRRYSLGALIPMGSVSIGPDAGEHSLELLPSAYLVLKGMTLPNEKALLALYNEQGKLIHGVSYRVPWDAPEWKKEGGWALESPDPNQVCLVSQGWAYAEDPSGGTPGRVNSNNFPGADQEPPLMLYSGYGESGELFLHYSEPIQLTGLNREDFMLRPGKLFPLELSLSQPLATRVILQFQEDLQTRQQFSMEVPALTDCQGNVSQKELLRGGRIGSPSYGALFFNEIMYDPLEGFPEYIELYNPGPGYFDLQDLAFQVTETGSSPDMLLPVSSRSRIFLPGQFLVLTSSVPWLEDAYGLYPSGSWVEVDNMPLLKNTGGSVILTDRTGTLVDQATYSDYMHMDLLNDTKGISLERISVDKSGSDPGNWHSAASISGYATPGEENSQTLDQLVATDLLEVEPAVFSPDNDGFQDVLMIAVSTGAQGWVISVWISDLSGFRIRQLANNHISGPSILYSWDGEHEDGSMVSAGFYVVHLWAYHPVSGERWRKRSAIGVMYR